MLKSNLLDIIVFCSFRTLLKSKYILIENTQTKFVRRNLILKRYLKIYLERSVLIEAKASRNQRKLFPIAIGREQPKNRSNIFRVAMLFCCVLISSIITAQEVTNSPLQLKQSITLNDVLNSASKNSLDAFKAKRKYGVNYWQFKSFKSSLLPKINFEARPFTFNQALVERYDSQQNIDVFRQQQNLNTFANVSLTQNIRATGTSLFVNSSFNRLKNSGDIDNESYNATPIRIGLIQPLMAFNPFKWEHETAPLQYQKAKQEFIYELQTINLKTVDLFFNWALASKKAAIAQENKQSAQKLFKIGKRRYDLGSIEKDDILNLELNKTVARHLFMRHS